MRVGDYPKHIKRKLRELAVVAYEEELKRALLSLGEQFDALKRGELSSGELDQVVHKYHSTTARELYGRYNNVSAEILVAYALTEGILRQEAIPDEVMPYLQNALALYRR